VDKIAKALQKLTSKEQKWVKDTIERLSLRKTEGLDIKKLKGREDIFRVRKSDIRIIYRFAPDDNIYILVIERRHENTYHF